MIKILKLHPLQGGDPSPIIVPKSEPGPCCSPANDDPFVICGFLSGCSTHPPPILCITGQTPTRWEHDLAVPLASPDVGLAGGFPRHLE